MSYHSEFFGVDVREDIAIEFTDRDGRVDDMMAGLHEIRARLLDSRAKPQQRKTETFGVALPDDSRSSS